LVMLRERVSLGIRVSGGSWLGKATLKAGFQGSVVRLGWWVDGPWDVTLLCLPLGKEEPVACQKGKQDLSGNLRAGAWQLQELHS
jgi:hypothetical protein